MLEFRSWRRCRCRRVSKRRRLEEDSGLRSTTTSIHRVAGSSILLGRYQEPTRISSGGGQVARHDVWSAVVTSPDGLGFIVQWLIREDLSSNMPRHLLVAVTFTCLDGSWYEALCDVILVDHDGTWVRYRLFPSILSRSGNWILRLRKRLEIYDLGGKANLRYGKTPRTASQISLIDNASLQFYFAG